MTHNKSLGRLCSALLGGLGIILAWMQQAPAQPMENETFPEEVQDVGWTGVPCAVNNFRV